MIKRFTSLLVASSLIVLSVPTRSNANPAALVAPALCAGTAGVGCVLIGVATIGGVVVYMWQHNSGKKVASDAQGGVMAWQPVSEELITNSQECEQYGQSHSVRVYWDEVVQVCFTQEW